MKRIRILFAAAAALGLLGCQLTVLTGAPAPAGETPDAAVAETANVPPPEGPTALPPTPAATAALALPTTQKSEDSGPADQRLALRPAFQADLAALTLNRYAIAVAVDVENHAYQGRLTLAYTNTETVALDSLYFRLFPNGGLAYGDGSLTTPVVRVDGVEINPLLSLDDSVLEAPLPARLQPGQSAQVEFEFVGAAPLNYGRGDDRGYGIFNATDNVLTLTGWFPLLAVYDEDGWNLDPVSNMGDSVYSDMALFTVDLTAPADAVVAASGVEIESRADGGFVQRRFVSGPAREFALALSPAYEVVSDAAGGVTVNSYYLPGHAGGGKEALETALQAVEVFSQAFGEYPYTELDVLETPLEYAAGVEFPGLVMIASSLYSPIDDFFVDVVAHETAHQWWYHLVGNDIFEDPWLDEALATYSEILFMEQVFGAADAREMTREFEDEYEQAIAWGMDDWVTASLDHFENDADAGDYGAVVYVKGALFYAALRQEIGDEALFTALRSYFQAQRYGIAAPAELLAAFETAAGRSLADFYQSWLYEAAR